MIPCKKHGRLLPGKPVVRTSENFSFQRFSGVYYTPRTSRHAVSCDRIFSSSYFSSHVSRIKVLCGIRRSGKPTLLKNILPGYRYVSLEDIDIRGFTISILLRQISINHISEHMLNATSV